MESTLLAELQKLYGSILSAGSSGGAQPGVAHALEIELEKICDELEKCGEIYDKAADALEQLITGEEPMDEGDDDSEEERERARAILQTLGTDADPEIDPTDGGFLDCEDDLATSTAGTRRFKAPRRL